MRLPTFRPPDRSRLTQRGVALVATLLVHLLLLLIVLMTRSPFTPRKVEQDLKTFSVMPEPEKKKEAGTKAKTKPAVVTASAPAEKTTETPPPDVAPRQKTEEQTPSFIQMSPSDFGATDIGKLASRGVPGGTGRAVQGPGEGPGGARLIDAEWVREPTSGELSPYLPENMPPDASAYLACRTIEHHHVENCQVVWERPAGLGLGRGLRRAAWQFLVRPLHLEGQSQVGKDIGILFEWRRVEQ